MMGKVMVCRCEDVPEAEIRAAVKNGYDDLESIKRYLAVGTGPCQAKHCLRSILKIIAEETGISPDGSEPFVSRPPISMTPLSFFLEDDEGEK